jgi:hypothetical protein
MLARAQIPLEWIQSEEDEESEELNDCLSNTHLSKRFREFGKELGALEAKSLEDIYKSHLENTSECGDLYTRCGFPTTPTQDLLRISTLQERIWLVHL